MVNNNYYLIATFLPAVIVGVFLATRIQNSPPALIEPKAEGKTVAVRGVTSSYDLIEQRSSAYGSVSSAISDYQPVTISHKVSEGDSLASVASEYHADAQTIVDYPYNEIGDDLTLRVGQVLIIPNGYIEQAPPPPPVAKGSGIFTWPAAGSISQYAYWWHQGAIDIVADAGTPVRAADNGRVVTVERLTTGYGYHVVLDHQTGYTSLYAHLSQINVELGQKISKGHVIGAIGSTGRSTGPHLHFEVRENGQPVDPMTLLPSL